MNSNPQETEATIATWDPPCIECGDLIGREVRAGYYVGEVRCGKCRGQADAERLRGSGVPRWFIDEGKSLDNFETRGAMPLTRALEQCHALIHPKLLDLERRWVVLSGDVGSGKSHLGAGVVAKAIGELHAAAAFTTFDRILLEITSSYGAGDGSIGPTSLEIVDRYGMNITFLAIDDVGVEQPTAHTIQMLYRILNDRLNSRLPTILTTNYPLEKKLCRAGQPTLGERLSEKLSDDTPVRRILDRIAGEAFYQHLDVTSYRRTKGRTPNV